MKKLFLVAGLLALSGCSDNSTATEPQDAQIETQQETVANPEAEVVAEVEPAEEAINVTADELLAAYKENELAGDKQFKGKTLLVTGVLDSIQSGVGDSPFLLLKAGDEFEFNMPQAHFDASETDSLIALKKGENIQIQCVSDGEMMGSPVLKNCKVVQIRDLLNKYRKSPAIQQGFLLGIKQS